MNNSLYLFIFEELVKLQLCHYDDFYRQAAGFWIAAGVYKFTSTNIVFSVISCFALL